MEVVKVKRLHWHTPAEQPLEFVQFNSAQPSRAKDTVTLMSVVARFSSPTFIVPA